MPKKSIVHVQRGTGPLRMWHVYCDTHGRVYSRNTRASARDAKKQHIERKHQH